MYNIAASMPWTVNHWLGNTLYCLASGSVHI